MGENKSSLPFFYYEEKVRLVSYVDILTKKKISGELDIDSMWDEVSDQMTRKTQEAFKLDSDQIAKAINKMRKDQTNEIQNNIQQLIIDVNEYLVYYTKIENYQKSLVKNNIQTAKDFKNALDKKTINPPDDINVDAKKGRIWLKPLADKAVQLYVKIIKIFQQLKLFDPNAVIVVYDKNGNREEINIDEKLTGSWKSQTKIDKIYTSCSIVGADMIEDAQRLFIDTVDIYNGIAKVREKIMMDYNNFNELVKNKVFDNMKSGYGGYIAEAFEIHYQNNINSFWENKNGEGHKIKLNDPEHYGGWSKIYSMLFNAGGTTEGYYRPDVNWAQVKKYTAEYIKISNLRSMLNILNDLLNDEIEPETIVQMFDQPEAYSNFKNMSNNFKKDFKEEVQRDINRTLIVDK